MIVPLINNRRSNHVLLYSRYLKIIASSNKALSTREIALSNNQRVSVLLPGGKRLWLVNTIITSEFIHPM
ncbi:hypothetical protein SRDD_29990 [Serratia sp. DD3]|nr:hypothetical protein SRDD_29990 [Serratia sp. DD3]